MPDSVQATVIRRTEDLARSTLCNEEKQELQTAADCGAVAEKIPADKISVSVEAEFPNEITITAMEEGNKLIHDEAASGYKTMEELKTALEE